jgi:hypothetical protein
VNLAQLEGIIPGTTFSRKDTLENMRQKIKENYDIDTELVSLYDIECMWLRARVGTNEITHIPDEYMLEFDDIAEMIRNKQKELNNGC